MDHSRPFLLSELFCGTPPSCFDDVLAEDGELLNVLPLAAPKIIESAPVPFGPLWALLGLKLGWTGLELGLGGLGTKGLGTRA